MAKTQAKTTLTPEAIGLGQKVLAQDAATVSKLVTWVAGRRRQQHFSLTLAGDGWGTNGVGTLRAALTGVSQTFIDTDAIVDADARAANVSFSAQVSTLAGAETAALTITVDGSLGTVTRTLNFTSADVTEKRVSFSIAAAVLADEWFRVRVTGSKTGAGGPYEIDLDLEEDEVTSGLPDPEDS